MSRPDAPHQSGIVDLLRSKLNSGEFPEGSKLPGEAALAEQLNASRSTVRRAVAELAREGLVSAARGRATFVRIHPERRNILIGDDAPHEDLLDTAYEPSRRGWIQVWPRHTSTPPAQGSSPDPPNTRIVPCDAEQSAALNLSPRHPIVLREARWRHQENGYLIAISSSAPRSLFDLKSTTGLEHDSEIAGDLAGDVAGDVAGDLAIDPEPVRNHGPATFTISVSARMPNARECVALEIEVGVPLLVLTRTMLDARGHPLECTVVRAPADRFDAAHSSRRPILDL